MSCIYTYDNDSTSDILLSNVKVESRCSEGTFEPLLHKKLINKTSTQKADLKYRLTRKYRETGIIPEELYHQDARGKKRWANHHKQQEELIPKIKEL
ncbi:hypothetical protein MBAV_002596, partial [Candidatus Magnetobacterium bavaricum]